MVMPMCEKCGDNLGSDPTCEIHRMRSPDMKAEAHADAMTAVANEVAVALAEEGHSIGLRGRALVYNVVSAHVRRLQTSLEAMEREIDRIAEDERIESDGLHSLELENAALRGKLSKIRQLVTED